jgi:hypothetical protein
MERKRVTRGVPTGGQFVREQRRKALVGPQFSNDDEEFTVADFRVVQNATKNAIRKFFGGNTGSSLRYQDVVEDVASDVMVVIAEKLRTQSPEERAKIRENLGGYAYNVARFAMLQKAKRWQEAKSLSEQLQAGVILADSSMEDDGMVYFNQVSSRNTRNGHYISPEDEYVPPIKADSKAEREVQRWDYIQSELEWDVQLNNVPLAASKINVRALRTAFGDDWAVAINKSWGDESLETKKKLAIQRWQEMFADEESARTVLSSLATFPAPYRSHVVLAMRYKMAES